LLFLENLPKQRFRLPAMLARRQHNVLPNVEQL